MDIVSYRIMSNYEAVTLEDQTEQFSWKNFLRQLVVSSVIWMNFFMYGLCIGGPTVYIPQIRREANCTDAVSEEMATWLTSIYGYGGIPWVIVLPIAASYFGRKVPHIVITINAFAAFLFFYLSKSVTEIFISQVMESVIGSSLTTISILVLTEYTSPRYRGIFLTFKSATLFWGIWVANAIGAFFHWKNIAIVKLVLSVYSLLVVLIWPESPYWLASNGYLKKCAASHRWLKGRGLYAEQELEKIIESVKVTDSSRGFKSIFSREFNKSTFLCFCVFGLYTFSGKMTCSVYSLDIIKKMTASESTAYTGMLLLDGISVFGMYIGTVLSKFFKRRTLFLSASSVGIISLWALGGYTYLIHLSVLTESGYISLTLLTLYSLGISGGPMIFCSSLYGELLPLHNRSLSMIIVALYDKILYGTVVKVAPQFMRILGLHTAFFFFGVTSAISLYLLYKFMPETKDKTLVQISEEIRGVANVSRDNNVTDRWNTLMSSPE